MVGIPKFSQKGVPHLNPNSRASNQTQCLERAPARHSRDIRDWQAPETGEQLLEKLMMFPLLFYSVLE